MKKEFNDFYPDRNDQEWVMGQDCIYQMFPINGMMCIATEEGPIYITREQARKFFGFTNENEIP